MRAVAWMVLVASLLPVAEADPPVEPVVLYGVLDKAGSLVLSWTAPVSLPGDPDSFTVTRTFVDEDGLPASNTVELPGSARGWVERSPPAGTVAYTVTYKVGVDDSPPSNPAVRGPWPHCAILLFLVLPPPPWYDLQPECLFPLPELPPDAP